jgi:hypothetical protein
VQEIIRASSRGAADNVVFDLTGNVYDDAGNWLGSLTGHLRTLAVVLTVSKRLSMDNYLINNDIKTTLT